MVCLLVSSTDKWRIVFLQAPDFKLWHFHKVTQLPIYRAVKKKKKKAWHHNFCGTINTTASTWVFRAEPLLNRAAVIDCRFPFCGLVILESLAVTLSCEDLIVPNDIARIFTAYSQLWLAQRNLIRCCFFHFFFWCRIPTVFFFPLALTSERVNFLKAFNSFLIVCSPQY